MRMVIFFTFIFFSTHSYSEGQEQPIEQKMPIDLYLCGLSYQLAEITDQGKNKKEAKKRMEEAKECSDQSKENIKNMVKKTAHKLEENAKALEKLKALYSAYLTYMGSIIMTNGMYLEKSEESRSFNERLNEYIVEIEFLNN